MNGKYRKNNVNIFNIQKKFFIPFNFPSNCSVLNNPHSLTQQLFFISLLSIFLFSFHHSRRMLMIARREILYLHNSKNFYLKVSIQCIWKRTVKSFFTLSPDFFFCYNSLRDRETILLCTYEYFFRICRTQNTFITFQLPPLLIYSHFFTFIWYFISHFTTFPPSSYTYFYYFACIAHSKKILFFLFHFYSGLFVNKNVFCHVCNKICAE